MPTKYVLITGGFVSGLGKGTVTSSIGILFRAAGFNVSCIKIDPYINIDAGLFNPDEHGECFVLDDGGEVDLDLGNYERALDLNLTRENNITTGKVYSQVISNERQGLYSGSVQVIPHLTDAIQNWIERVGKGNTICLIELGGTIGDIEAMPFVEALRQFRIRVHEFNFCQLHVSLVPCVGPSKECKSKPTQVSIAESRKCGLEPSLVILRSETGVSKEAKAKVSFYANLPLERIIDMPTLSSLYNAPIWLRNEGLFAELSKCLNLDTKIDELRLEPWYRLSDMAVNIKETVDIALVGKYVKSRDNYHSVIKALEHACYSLGKKPNIIMIDSAHLETNEYDAWEKLKSSKCLLVPGGFGVRGSEGKILAIKYARENKMPFLGICFGFQLAVIEYARNVLEDKLASSAEFLTEPDLNRSYIIEMLDYKDVDGKLGGTMRLGRKRTTIVKEGTILESYYKSKNIDERHRHRFEVNPMHVPKLEERGLQFVGKNEDGSRMEILELERNLHPFFVAVQFHPEYLSRPTKPSPTYVAFVAAAIAVKND